MRTCDHWWVKTARIALFIQKCPQFSQKFSASNASILRLFPCLGASSGLMIKLVVQTKTLPCDLSDFVWVLRIWFWDFSYLLENKFQMGWMPDIMVFQKLHYFHTKSGVPGLPKNVDVLRARLLKQILIIIRNNTYFANFWTKVA